MLLHLRRGKLSPSLLHLWRRTFYRRSSSPSPISLYFIDHCLTNRPPMLHPLSAILHYHHRYCSITDIGDSPSPVATHIAAHDFVLESIYVCSSPKIDLYVYVFVFEIDLCVYEFEIHHCLFLPLCLLRLLNFRPPPQVDYVIGDNPRRAVALGFLQRMLSEKKEGKSSWVNLCKEKRFLWLHLHRVTYGVYVSTQRSKGKTRCCKP
ncbi:unnamed protein product [Lactuca saligna]|uniref:Uncharacterized protein n=1 Tax=Lactuca saligna TaxID=75948 RepID=A0AA36EA90_LACSI|nr:unnamed protein product [Lactuca saligna]